MKYSKFVSIIDYTPNFLEKYKNNVFYIIMLQSPKQIDSIFWNEEKKSWDTKKIHVEEYHGFTECRYCHKPMSHNVKTDGQFKVIYTKCGCTRM